MLHEAQADSKDEPIILDDDLWNNIQLGGDGDLLHLAARARSWDQRNTHESRPPSPLVDEYRFASHLHPFICLVSEPQPWVPGPSLRLHEASGECAGSWPASGQPLLVLRSHQVRNILPLYHL